MKISAIFVSHRLDMVCSALRGKFGVLIVAAISIISHASAAAEVGGLIPWQSFDQAKELSQSTGKPMMLYFHADWCKICSRMDATSLSDNAVASAIDTTVVPVLIRTDSDDSLTYRGKRTTSTKLTKEFGVQGYPSFIFLTGDECLLGQTRGLLNSEGLISYLLKVAKMKCQSSESEARDKSATDSVRQSANQTVSGSSGQPATKYVTCTFCGGLGHSNERCGACNGTGSVNYGTDYAPQIKRCSPCNGTGKRKCTACNGTGTVAIRQ